VPIFSNSATSAEVATGQQTEQEVVQVYFDDVDNLAYLTTNYDVWEEAISRQDYVTILASKADREVLAQKGYKIAVDQELTASLHRPAPRFACRGQSNAGNVDRRGRQLGQIERRWSNRI